MADNSWGLKYKVIIPYETQISTSDRQFERCLLNPCIKLFIERLPKNPYCTNELGQLYIRNQDGALKRAYLQFNRPDVVSTLVFDIDEEGAALIWKDVGLPPPHWIAINTENGHAHLGYQLATPVCRTDAARALPLRYLAAIERAMTVRLRADEGFAGLLTKNPLHANWRTIWHSHEPYTLGYLADFFFQSELFGYRSKPEPVGLGRNVCLFDMTRRWAYRAIREYWAPNGMDRWERAVMAHLEGLNVHFATSEKGMLPHSDIRAIARSIARWTWKRTTPSGFCLAQAIRGAVGGAKSRRPTKSGKRKPDLLMRVVALKKKGFSNRAIAEEMGIGAATVSRYLRSVKDGK